MENGKFSSGGTTSYGVNFSILGKDVGISRSYYHETHFVPGDINQSKIHHYNLAFVSQIDRCHYTERTDVFFLQTKKNNY